MMRRQFSQWCGIVVCILLGAVATPAIVRAQSDTTPPVLQSFSFTPTAIDTDAGAQTLRPLHT